MKESPLWVPGTACQSYTSLTAILVTNFQVPPALSRKLEKTPSAKKPRASSFGSFVCRLAEKQGGGGASDSVWSLV